MGPRPRHAISHRRSLCMRLGFEGRHGWGRPARGIKTIPVVNARAVVATVLLNTVILIFLAATSGHSIVGLARSPQVHFAAMLDSPSVVAPR
jgi:hypothetical protein